MQQSHIYPKTTALRMVSGMYPLRSRKTFVFHSLMDIEMAFALVLHKPIYCLYEIPDMPYTSEIEAMQPIALNGDLSSL